MRCLSSVISKLTTLSLLMDGEDQEIRKHRETLGSCMPRFEVSRSINIAGYLIDGKFCVFFSLFSSLRFVFHFREVLRKLLEQNIYLFVFNLLLAAFLLKLFILIGSRQFESDIFFFPSLAKVFVSGEGKGGEEVR